MAMVHTDLCHRPQVKDTVRVHQALPTVFQHIVKLALLRHIAPNQPHVQIIALVESAQPCCPVICVKLPGGAIQTVLRSGPPARPQNAPRSARSGQSAPAERPPFCARGPERERRTPPRSLSLFLYLSLPCLCHRMRLSISVSLCPSLGFSVSPSASFSFPKRRGCSSLSMHAPLCPRRR